VKLFHTENGKEVVYVQMQDLMHLNSIDIPIPASIYVKVFTRTIIVDDSNRFEFVKFDEEHEIKFFRELDFVIDFEQYVNLTDEQLEEKRKKLSTKAQEIVEKWNSMTQEERQKSDLPEEYENLGYMLMFLSEIYSIKYGKRVMPFPDFVKLPKVKKKKMLFKRKKDVK